MLDEKSVSKLAMAGHTIHPDRSTYTHAIYAQETNNLKPDQEIKEKGEPIFAPHLGRNLRVGDVLPERLCLAVNKDGELLSKNDFKERYRNYLRGFFSTRNPEYEPVPNPKQFVMQVLDPSKPPDGGKAHYVEVGFDPLNQGTPKETGEWHPDGIKMDEWRKRNPDAAAQLFAPANERDAKVQLIMELHQAGEISERAMLDRLSGLYGNKRNGEEVAETTEPDADATGSSGVDYETAPCGKNHKKGYAQQHQRFCKNPACNTKASD